MLTRSSCPTSLLPHLQQVTFWASCDVPLLLKKKKSSNHSMSPCQLFAAECWSRCPEVNTSLSMPQEELNTRSDTTCLGHYPKSSEQVSYDQRLPGYGLWQLEATLPGDSWWVRWSIYHVISKNHLWQTSLKALFQFSSENLLPPAIVTYLLTCTVTCIVTYLHNKM